MSATSSSSAASSTGIPTHGRPRRRSWTSLLPMRRGPGSPAPMPYGRAEAERRPGSRRDSYSGLSGHREAAATGRRITRQRRAATHDAHHGARAHVPEIAGEARIDRHQHDFLGVARDLLAILADLRG